MRAVLLAGGRGDRLRPLSHYRPKALVPIANRPLVARLLTTLADGGVGRATLAIGSGQEPIRAALGETVSLGRGRRLDLRYAIESAPLGSGGAVAAALSGGLAGDPDPDAPVLVCNADIVSDFDPRALLRAHRTRGAQASLGLVRADGRLRAGAGRYGMVALEADGRISRFLEKPSRGDRESDEAGQWINAGVWLLDPALLADVAPDRFSRLEDDLFPALAAAGGAIFGVPLWRDSAGGSDHGLWIDVGTPPDYLRANRVLLRREGGSIDPAARVDASAVIRGAVQIAAGAVVDADARLTGPLALGLGSHIGARAELRDSVVWDDVRVGAGARVSGSILSDGAVVAPGEVLRAAIRTRDRAEDAALAGARAGLASTGAGRANRAGGRCG